LRTKFFNFQFSISNFQKITTIKFSSKNTKPAKPVLCFSKRASELYVWVRANGYLSVFAFLAAGGLTGVLDSVLL